MPESSFVARLRQAGGPSHELLVLLDQHRVLTTDQCARASDAPQRTVRWRLDRLREHGLVASIRPGREAGSAPAHWWLRPAGARLVAGTAVAEGQRAPSGMHLAHAAAIAEVWLALREHGPAAGLRLVRWWTDRAGWQQWQPAGGYGRRRLTPDAVAHLQLVDEHDPTATAAVFIEVDLASMTQVLLKQKGARYLAYAADRAWQGQHPHCPPLLLLTTTASRAATFLRGAGPMLAGQDRPGYRGDADVVHAEALVVAACGLVRQPARAVVELCWAQTDPAAAEVSLAELLAERVTAQARADAWRERRAARARRLEQITVLHELARDDRVDDLLGDEHAGEALRFLVGRDAAGWMDTDPDLTAAVLAWWADPSTDPGPVQRELLARHRRLWTDHAQVLLTADDHLAADDPHLAVYARTLQQGRLLSAGQLLTLAEPPKRTREQVQAAALGDYPARRDTEVATRWAGLSWMGRRRTSPAELAAAYDVEHLWVCDTCGVLAPRPDPDSDDYTYWQQPDECTQCGDGRRIDYTRRSQVPTLTHRLAIIRARLPT